MKEYFFVTHSFYFFDRNGKIKLSRVKKLLVFLKIEQIKKRTIFVNFLFTKKKFPGTEYGI